MTGDEGLLDLPNRRTNLDIDFHSLHLYFGISKTQQITTWTDTSLHLLLHLGKELHAQTLVQALARAIGNSE